MSESAAEAPSAAPPPEEPKMDIHKPKPFHTLREFLKEVGTIVLGVCIALSAEQAVEAYHERALAREARAAIREEMRGDVARLQYRLASQECIVKRVGEITGLLAGWADGKEIPAGLEIGYPGDVLFNDQRWQANLNSGRFSREAEAEQASQTALYNLMHIIATDELEEHQVWDQMRVLDQGSNFLTPAYRPRLIEALTTARYKGGEIATLGNAVLRMATEQNLLPEKPFVPAMKDTTCQPMTAPGK